jgi:hypothetical protein
MALLMHGLSKKVADWPYSRFLRYVKKGVYTSNWGEGINALDVGE